MRDLSALIQELKALIIRELRIEAVKPEDIDNDAPLFGEGLGLDSLDAMELTTIIEKQYGINLRDMEEARKVFVSIKRLAEHIREYSK